MVCLPLKDPNQFDLFSDEINFGPEPSTAFPPNMQEIMDELNNPNAILPSPNIAVVNDVDNAIAAVTPAQILLMTPPNQQLFNNNFEFGNDPQFDPYTTSYNANLPPLINGLGGPNGTLGGIQDIVNMLRTQLTGLPNTIPGALGSMGQTNALQMLSYGNASNLLQKSLGLGAIPDCGLFDLLLGLLKRLLQPLIDLLAELLGPLIDFILKLLAILAAILAELLNLLGLLQRLLNFANAGQLLNLGPCGLLNMAQIGAPSLNTQINSGIAWSNPDLPQIPDPGEFVF